MKTSEDKVEEVLRRADEARGKTAKAIHVADVAEYVAILDGVRDRMFGEAPPEKEIEKEIDSIDELLRRVKQCSKDLNYIRATGNHEFEAKYVRRAVTMLDEAREAIDRLELERPHSFPADPTNLSEAKNALSGLITSLRSETTRAAGPMERKGKQRRGPRKSTTTIKEDLALLDEYDRDYSNESVAGFARIVSKRRAAKGLKKIREETMRGKLNRARDYILAKQRKTSGRS